MIPSKQMESEKKSTSLPCSVFISEPIDAGWIIEKLMRDLAAQLNEMGIETHIGKPDAYAGQEVVFHSRYLYATAVRNAKVNSLFITHIDDKLKEIELRSRIVPFNSFVCTSFAEANLVRALGCPEHEVVGIPLPHRGGVVKRPRMAFFSARYDDGRKNENWLVEYFESRDDQVRNSMIICLIGYDWESFCVQLASLGLSFELYRYDRQLPGEYDNQKAVLERMNYLIYPGFDGGAMCIYDGITAGLGLVLSDNGYHRDLGSNARLFRNKEQFFSELDQIANTTIAREKVLANHTILSYAHALVAHWSSILERGSDSVLAETRFSSQQVNIDEQNEELRFYRTHYKSLSPKRIASAVYRQGKFFFESLMKPR